MTIVQYDIHKRPINYFATTDQAAKENGFYREEVFRAINSNTHFLRKRECYFSRNTQPLVPDDKFKIGDIVTADSFFYDHVSYKNIVGEIVQIYENSVCLDIYDTSVIPEEIKYRLAGRIVVAKRHIKKDQFVMEG